jgi:hypothetical protein
VKGDVGAAVAVAEGRVKVNQDLRSLERKFVNPITIRVIKPKSEPLTRPAADVAASPAPKAPPAAEVREQLTARKRESTHAPPRPAPGKTSPPKTGKPFPVDEEMKKGKLRLSGGKEADEMCDIPHGISANRSRRPDKEWPRIVMNGDVHSVSSTRCVWKKWRLIWTNAFIFVLVAPG